MDVERGTIWCFVSRNFSSNSALLGQCQRVDAATWRKKIEEISNKSPSAVEIVKEDDIKKLELSQASSFSAKCQANYSCISTRISCVRTEMYREGNLDS